MRTFLEFVEGYNRASIGQFVKNYDPKANIGDNAWTGERVAELQEVITAAKQKFIQIINSNPKIKAEWPTVKEWLNQNETQLLRFSHRLPDTVLIDAGSGAPTEITPDGMLKVSSEMKSLIEWRFIIKDAERMFTGGRPPKHYVTSFLNLLGQFLH